MSLSAQVLGSNENLCRQDSVRETCAGYGKGRWTSLRRVRSNQSEEDNRRNRICRTNDMDRKKVRLC